MELRSIQQPFPDSLNVAYRVVAIGVPSSTSLSTPRENFRKTDALA